MRANGPWNIQADPFVYAVYENKEKILNILMKLQLGFSIMEMLNIQERVFNFCGKEKR